MFGRLKNFWSAQQQSSEIPWDLERIVTGLPDGWHLLSFEWLGGEDWKVELGFDGRRFEIESDRGYPWTAIELSDEPEPILTSPINERWWANGTPEQIHAALAQITPRKK